MTKKRMDELERDIERALMPATYVGHRGRSDSIEAVETVKAKITPLIREAAGAARVVALLEVFIAGCYVKAEELTRAHPVSAAKLQVAMALRILKERKSKYFDAALRNLEQARKAMLKKGRVEEWETLSTEIRTAGRKEQEGQEHDGSDPNGLLSGDLLGPAPDPAHAQLRSRSADGISFLRPAPASFRRSS